MEIVVRDVLHEKAGGMMDSQSLPRKEEKWTFNPNMNRIQA